MAEGDDSGAFVLPTDFSQLLGLPETAFADSDDVLACSTGSAELMQPTCLAHPDTTDCLCNGFMGGWDIPEPVADPYIGVEEPDYGKFENWIPEFVRPEKPCDYCRARRLNCYITRGETGCTSCNVLFRECSLTNSCPTSVANQPCQFLLDTLHAVDEDVVKEQGTVVGIKPLRSKAGTYLPSRGLDDAPGSSKRNGIRFPRHAVKTLRDWLDDHLDNPYPTDEEKVELEKKTELKQSQILNWLANARRRRKVTERSRPRLCSSPSMKPSTPAICIPAVDKPWDELNPFERWKNSPPENEPASITDIANAVANSDLPDDQVSTSPSSLGRRKHRSSAGSGFSNAKAPSTTSFETGQSSSLSASTSAAYSHHSSQSHGSFGSFSSGLAGKKDRRRRRRPAQTTLRKAGDEKKRIFQCTFCTDSFKSKYDWTRHEKSLHLSLEKWICAPLGPVITDPVGGHRRCVYCDEQNPTEDHLETHNHRRCEEKGLDARTFYRKDHLRQHLRLMHNCEMTPFMDNWKSIAVNINSRCGFCAKRFTVWQERVDHLTAHFKAGARMSEWKGCRGLDPAVAAQVTNAMPPYLIGMESVSPVPFSASNRATWRPSCFSEKELDTSDRGNVYSEQPQDQQSEPEVTDLPSKATCWEILTVRLGKYANEMAAQGTVLSDEMLQSAARRILYDSDDSWNQTAADNPEWLDLFKKAHGLDFIPGAIGGQGEKIPEDLETYGDLGLRIPFAVQLQAYNQSQADAEMCHCGKVPGQHLKAHHDKRMGELNRIYMTLSKEGVLHNENGKCKHTECKENVLEASTVDGSSGSAQKHYRWCTYELPPQKAREIAALTAPLSSSTVLASHNGTAGPLDESKRSINISQSLRSLYNMDTRLSLNHGSCEWIEHDARVAQARAKAQVECVDPEAAKKPYLQRHRYELPKHRAQRFATTTGPWEDSGSMPEPVMTSAGHMDPQMTTTGAMMEFLGGDVGQTLPFGSDAETSMIPLGSDFDWALPTSTADEAAMIDDVDRLIAETTAAQTQQPTSADALAAQMTSGAMPSSMAMEDLNFDMDVDFEGVFDMPMDETFGYI